jgi:NAD(P)H-hydrate epimerase
LPAITADQMREVDRIMVEDLGILLVQMMENAGRHLADLAVERYRPSRIVVLAGPGGNGGGGLVAARHLANRDVDVEVVLAEPERLTGVTTHQHDILMRMGVDVTATTTGGPPGSGELILDALLGYALHGDPREPSATLIRWANDAESRVLSLDLPSGLDATTGQIGAPCVIADATLTLALPKVGLACAPAQVGELFVADISVPTELYRRLGLEVGNVFVDGPIVRART